MYLVDSNVWLELLLDQESAEEVRQFLQKVEANEILMTEFTLYSIGLITTRLKKEAVFEEFISDILEESGVERISLSASDLKELLSASREFGLDFDDAYQYVAAKSNDLVLVSFDKDFDKTDIERRTPKEITQKGPAGDLVATDSEA